MSNWLEEAGSLEDQILDHARRAPDGEVIWQHPAKPGRLGWNLYDGVTGVALFLAAMERVEPREGRRECVLSALASLRRRLREEAHDPRHPLGAFAGLGGYIYSFALIGCWLGEPELTAEAARIATLITPDRIAADDALDVMSGCAGAALALLALDGMLPGLVDRAIACGEHLLRRRVSMDSEPRAWAAKGLPPRCGFAHGAAGIAFCLARLFEHTGETKFRDAAEEGVAFEQRHYDPEHGNWPLVTVPSGASFMAGWCTGAPGIALGRVGMFASVQSFEICQGARSALRTTMTCREAACDFLCCGEMGKAEILLQAHEVLREADLLEGATKIASRIISRSRNQGGRYRWFGPKDSRFVPTFFRGAAGVGYSLLRLAKPTLLPCVLSLDWREPQ